MPAPRQLQVYPQSSEGRFGQITAMDITTAVNIHSAGHGKVKHLGQVGRGLASLKPLSDFFGIEGYEREGNTPRIGWIGKVKHTFRTGLDCRLARSESMF